jgi:hypothetical protein
MDLSVVIILAILRMLVLVWILYHVEIPGIGDARQ